MRLIINGTLTSCYLLFTVLWREEGRHDSPTLQEAGNREEEEEEGARMVSPRMGKEHLSGPHWNCSAPL